MFFPESVSYTHLYQKKKYISIKLLRTGENCIGYIKNCLLYTSTRAHMPALTEGGSGPCAVNGKEAVSYTHLIGRFPHISP